MNQEPFDLVDREGDRVRVRCMRCAVVHMLPPIREWPFSLTCGCGAVRRFFIWHGKQLLEEMKLLPDGSEGAHRRFPPKPN